MLGMEPTDIEPLSSAEEFLDSACLGCGCVCDDIDIVVKQGRIVGADNACSIGVGWLLEESGGPACKIAGEPAGLDEGIARAAEILAGARFPLVTGLEEASIESQKVAIQIARRIGARLDTTTSPGRQAYWLAVQDVGAVGCTLGEIRHRGDLIIVWRADPNETHPRHFERYSIDAVGNVAHRGRVDRFVIAVDETETTDCADRFIRLSADQEIEALVTLRALARGVALDADQVAARTGSPLQTWQDMFTKMKEARYGVLLFEPSPDRLRNAAILRLVRDMNEHTRFVGSPLGAAGNAAGAEQVALWSTGYPGAVDLARGVPRYLPDESTTAALLERGLVDAILVVSGDPALLATSRGSVILLNVPTVVLGGRENVTMRSATVGFRVARLGREDSGTVFRSDGAPIPVRECLVSLFPGTRELLARIDQAIAALPERGPAFHESPGGS